MARDKSVSQHLKWIVGGIWVGVIGIGFVVFSLLSRNPGFSENSGQPANETILPTSPDAALPDDDFATEASPLPSQSPTTFIEIQTPTSSPVSAETQISSDTETPAEKTYFEGPIIIGYSVGDRPIEVYRFGTGSKIFIVVAGIHGGYEVNTIILADQLIAHFSTRPELIPNDTTLYILRALNPDGLAFTHKLEGRSNMNNVDINRNFPVEWSSDWDRDGCWDYIDINAGLSAASEPETLALMDFVLEHPPIALISYHSAAPGFYPAGDPPDPASDKLSHYLSQASGYPYPSFDPGCQMTGTLVDWVASTGAAAVDVELSNHWNPDYDINLKLVLALINWSP